MAGKPNLMTGLLESFSQCDIGLDVSLASGGNDGDAHVYSK
jgi:hypothetical protein